MSPRRLVVLLALSLSCAPTLAAAQPFATLSWQLQPYCNRVTLTINQDGAVFSLDGYDDQCGAGRRAPIVGSAVQNPDGSIGLGFTAVTTAARPVHVEARVNPGNGSGSWVDSAGNSGTLALNAAGGGAPRPAPSAGPMWGTVIQSASPTSPVGLAVVVDSPVLSEGAAVAAQWGAAPSSSPSSPAAVRGVSADQFGVLGASSSSSGVAGTSSSGMGVSGESVSGPGAFGMSSTGPGVMAVNSGTGTGVALEVSNGAIKVTGGVTPAFDVTTSPTNTSLHVTTLDHPLLNDRPNAMVFVTRVWGSGGSTANITGPLGVFYNGTHWAIFREDGFGIPFNTRFNVLVVSR